MESKKIVWITEPDGFSNTALSILENKFEVICEKIQADELISVLYKCDVLLLKLGFNLKLKLLNKPCRCKIIACPATGIDHIDTLTAAQYGIKIISLKGEVEFLRNIKATAEFTFAIIFNLLRNISIASNDVQKGNWNRDLFCGVELFQKKLGIIGYGRLGTLVAQYGKSFGMEIYIYEINPEIRKDLPPGMHCMSLKELISSVDIISMHIDLNQDNIDFCDYDFFKAMKPTSYFINTARGQLVDEAALIHALKEKWIAGAALDVIKGELSVNPKNELIQYASEHDNLLITPHIGGNTYESREKTDCFIAEKIIHEYSID